VAAGNAAIPNADYTVQGRAHRLQTVTPNSAQGLSGRIDISWTPTTETQNTFSGQWTEQHGNQTKRTTENQFHSTASVSGNLAGLTVGNRPAWVSTLNQKVQ
jgi:hypothetical protein